MNCNDYRQNIDAYIDGELVERERAEVEAHAGVCASCASVLERRRATRAQLRALAAAPAPDAFRTALRGRIAATTPVLAAERATSRRPILVAAAAAITVAGVGSALYAGRGEGDAVTEEERETDTTAAIVDESIRWHRRQIPVEVTGPDGNDVRNWFADKVDFPVRVPELTRANLLGGRLGNVESEEAAFLVYELDGTKLSVMMFDPDDPSLGRIGAPAGQPTVYEGPTGYNVVLRQFNGVAYTFTSELPGQELVGVVNAALGLPPSQAQ
jgi:anti-sigma factor RsiW